MTYYILQTAFLGDVLLTLPMCAAIKKMDAGARVVLITTPAAAEFVRGLGIVDEVVAFDKRGAHRSSAGRGELVASLTTNGPITAVVPHKSMRTMFLARALKAERVVTYADAATRWIASDTIPYPMHLHDTRRHLKLLEPLFPHVPTIEELTPIRLFTSDDGAVIESMVPAAGGLLAVVAPGSAWPTKQWPADRFRALAERLVHSGVQVAVLGDAATQGLMQGLDGVVDLSGRTTLRQAAALIARANVVISNDSAPVHLASLQHVPVIAVFGPTVPEFGFAPFGPNGHVIEQRELACRPCSAHGTVTCPLGTHECMTTITVDTVFDSVLHTLHAHDENRYAPAKTNASSS
ncbi:MAG: glycosyltransferase family 9 protein [Ignavibacteria bacterium]|nr:glycosyltransferase family 9 protein [Ignavibacteria bacterium]